MRPFRFRPPIHLAAAGAMALAGLASYQGVDHLVLAKSNRTFAGTEVGHEPTGSSTSTTIHHEPTGSSTSTTVHTELPPSTTSTTVHHEPTGSSTSTTIHHEPTGPSTSTTIHYEPPATTSTTKVPEPPTTTVQTLSFGCITGTPSDGIPTAKCGWSKSTSTGFHYYRLTRELVGTPRVTIFTTDNRDTTFFYDRGLQPGAEYSYIIEAYDGAGNLIGRGGPAYVTCCTGGTGTQ